MPNCCYSQECLLQWKHKVILLIAVPISSPLLRMDVSCGHWAGALRPLRWTLGGGQGLSALSGGLLVVGRGSPPSRVDFWWWTGALRPLRWTLRGGQWFSELSEGLSTMSNGSPPSQVDSPTGLSQFSILLLIKVTIRFFYILDISTNSTDPLITYSLSQTCTLN